MLFVKVSGSEEVREEEEYVRIGCRVKGESLRGSERDERIVSNLRDLTWGYLSVTTGGGEVSASGGTRGITLRSHVNQIAKIYYFRTYTIMFARLDNLDRIAVILCARMRAARAISSLINYTCRIIINIIIINCT